jgi:hypothetical protein
VQENAIEIDSELYERLSIWSKECEQIHWRLRLWPRRSPRNTETLVSTNVPTPGFDTVRIDHTPEPCGGLKALQDKGLRITSYVETNGSGAPITRRRYDDDDDE